MLSGAKCLQQSIEGGFNLQRAGLINEWRPSKHQIVWANGVKLVLDALKEI
ncbi:MAG: hypothetical protein ACTS44_00970 [Candidatus Hodgkinia cicadicola]